MHCDKNTGRMDLNGFAACYKQKQSPCLIRLFSYYDQVKCTFFSIFLINSSILSYSPTRKMKQNTGYIVYRQFLLGYLILHKFFQSNDRMNLKNLYKVNLSLNSSFFSCLTINIFFNLETQKGIESSERANQSELANFSHRQPSPNSKRIQ